MWRRFSRALALSAIAALLAGCGSQHIRADGTSRGSAAATGAARWALAAPIAIAGLRTSDGGRALVIDALVPDGRDDCVRDLHGTYDTAEHGVVYIYVTFKTPSFDRGSGCTKERHAQTTARLPKRLGSRKVMVNSDTTDVFTPVGANPPALRLCGKNGCDPTPPRCTANSYWQAVNDTDTPKHTRFDERGCDGTWLVLDLSQPTGPACGDAPDCASPVRIQRWFYRAKPSGWRPVATDGAPGCAGIHRVIPQLPRKLCAELPGIDPH